MVARIFFWIGNNSLKFLQSIGRYCIFVYNTFLSAKFLGKRWKQLFLQMYNIGVASIPLIAITSIFTGMVTAVQASYQTSGFLPNRLVGVMITKSTMIELAPVLTALVLAGKIGASMAAEIGSMRISNQIDALEMLSINPFDYLFFPRILAGSLMLPVLTTFSNLFGIVSGYFVSLGVYNITHAEFVNGIKAFFEPLDFWSGIIKALFFGFIITSIGCFTGYYAREGAQGVRKVATKSVVYGCILILITDFAVASILFQ
ncbi:MAG: ABC transporter permease [Candidatus Cloacimonetes bacterium]|nr:ABC transporter permease [Candidatus Cloacimonadota bacterium]